MLTDDISGGSLEMADEETLGNTLHVECTKPVSIWTPVLGERPGETSVLVGSYGHLSPEERHLDSQGHLFVECHQSGERELWLDLVYNSRWHKELFEYNNITNINNDKVVVVVVIVVVCVCVCVYIYTYTHIYVWVCVRVCNTHTRARITKTHKHTHTHTHV